VASNGGRLIAAARTLLENLAEAVPSQQGVVFKSGGSLKGAKPTFHRVSAAAAV